MDEDLKELISCFSNLTEDEKMSEISKKSSRFNKYFKRYNRRRKKL